MRSQKDATNRKNNSIANNSSIEGKCGRCCFFFLQRQQSGEAVSLYKGGAGQAGHAAAAAAADNRSHPVSQQGVRPVCLAVISITGYFQSLFIRFGALKLSPGCMLLM